MLRDADNELFSRCRWWLFLWEMFRTVIISGLWKFRKVDIALFFFAERRSHSVWKYHQSGLRLLCKGLLRSLKHCGVFNGVRRITATHQTRTRTSPKHIEKTSAGCCRSPPLPGNRQRVLFSAVLPPQPQEFAPAHLHLLSRLKWCQHPPLRLFLQGFYSPMLACGRPEGQLAINVLPLSIEKVQLAATAQYFSDTNPHWTSDDI